MKICIVGAGAIGGYIGAKLALCGEQVTLIARGDHLYGIKKKGLKLVMADESEHVLIKDIFATDDISKAGQQDIVILALKAHSLPAVAPTMRTLYGSETIVVTAQNGIPWWYFRKHGGEFEGYRLHSVDPNGIIETNIEVERVIGCVIYAAASLTEPGIVQYIDRNNQFLLGELDGSKTERIQLLSQTLSRAGLKAPIQKKIRSDIWVKLWGNQAFNPISALTRATLKDICQYPLTRELASNMMTEAQTIASRLGIDFGLTKEERMNRTEKFGSHKSSMLQDIEAGRLTEIDAIVGVVAELGKLTKTPTPHINAIYSSVKLLEKKLNS